MIKYWDITCNHNSGGPISHRNAPSTRVIAINHAGKLEKKSEKK